eukprot:TRINITY_DN310_c0_g2_i1.p1 TRINITY_DN310_c0_g2~~TRINITY_DN310_c0_g2_i1.p1  ORF type:complete len:222 (+),score=28.63 TRINITY_DN310_c0_g2_i1:18-683(+)
MVTTAFYKTSATTASILLQFHIYLSLFIKTLLHNMRYLYCLLLCLFIASVCAGFTANICLGGCAQEDDKDASSNQDVDSCQGIWLSIKAEQCYNLTGNFGGLEFQSAILSRLDSEGNQWSLELHENQKCLGNSSGSPSPCQVSKCCGIDASDKVQWRSLTGDMISAGYIVNELYPHIATEKKLTKLEIAFIVVGGVAVVGGIITAMIMKHRTPIESYQQIQ